MHPEIQAAFNKYPEATFAFTEIGHAYGTAKYNGTCSITGMPFHAGDKCRMIEGVTRAGVEFKVYTPYLGIIEKYWRRDIPFEGNRTVHLFSWRKVSDGWVEDSFSSLQAGDKDSHLVVLKNNGQTSVYSRHPLGWRKAGSHGPMSEKKLLASLRRTKSGRWLVVQ